MNQKCDWFPNRWAQKVHVALEGFSDCKESPFSRSLLPENGPKQIFGFRFRWKILVEYYLPFDFVLFSPRRTLRPNWECMRCKQPDDSEAGLINYRRWTTAGQNREQHSLLLCTRIWKTWTKNNSSSSPHWRSRSRLNSRIIFVFNALVGVIRPCTAGSCLPNAFMCKLYIRIRIEAKSCRLHVWFYICQFLCCQLNQKWFMLKSCQPQYFRRIRSRTWRTKRQYITWRLEHGTTAAPSVNTSL